MSKPQQTLSKLDAEQNFTTKTGDLEPSQLPNGTFNIRRKRLSEKLCRGGYYSPQARDGTYHPCVKRWYYCSQHGIREAECEWVSSKCLPSIPKAGVPKCQEQFENKLTKTSSGQIIYIKYVKDCECF